MMKKLQRYSIVFIIFVLLFTLAGCNAPPAPSPEKFLWKNLKLSHKLPEPKMNSGVISSDNASCMIVKFYDVTKDYYQEYVNTCENHGFSIDPVTSTNLFEGFNHEGYKLRLEYHPTSGNTAMIITLDEPEKLEPIQWPDTTPAEMIPTPPSAYGKIEKSTERELHIRMGDITIEQFLEYAQACADAGFNVNSLLKEKSYDAKDEHGNTLELQYEGFNTISIKVKVKSVPVASPSPSPSETPSEA